MTVALQDDGELASIMADEDAGTLCLALFGHDLSPTQTEIAHAIAFPKGKDRVVVSAHTRFGKTFGAADGLSLRFLLEEKPYAFRSLGPTAEQAGLLRGYMVDNFIHQPLLANLLDLPSAGVKSLRKEVSKTRFTFQDGKEFTVQSAQGDAERLMGFGGDVLLLDESALIRNATYEERISRMLGDNPLAELYEFSNPWHKLNQFWRHWSDPAFRRIHVNAEQGLLEGRITRDFLEEQRRTLSPLSFRVLYDSEFPDASEDQLIPWSWIERAIQPATWTPPLGEAWHPIWGMDCAEGGGDANVLTKAKRGPLGRFAVLGQDKWWEADTDKTAARVHAAVGHEPLGIDEGGVGKGIADNVRARGSRQVQSFKAGREAAHKDRFTNLISEVLWSLRDAFEQERVILVAPPADLLTDLVRYRKDEQSGRIRVYVEGGKSSGNSPDHGDSMAHAYWTRAQPPTLVPTGRIRVLT